MSTEKLTEKQRAAIQAGYIGFDADKLVCRRFHENGKPQFSPDGTMLDENGNRSIFDDVDE